MTEQSPEAEAVTDEPAGSSGSSSSARTAHPWAPSPPTMRGGAGRRRRRRARATSGQLTDLVEQPAKVMRIGSMIRQLLEEVKSAPLDEASRQPAQGDPPRLDQGARERAGSGAGRGARAPHRCPSPRTRPRREGELRIAQAQLVGWLEGLFHGIQTAIYAQQMAARAQLEQMRRSLPPGMSTGHGHPGRCRCPTRPRPGCPAAAGACTCRPRAQSRPDARRRTSARPRRPTMRDGGTRGQRAGRAPCGSETSTSVYSSGGGAARGPRAPVPRPGCPPPSPRSRRSPRGCRRRCCRRTWSRRPLTKKTHGRPVADVGPARRPTAPRAEVITTGVAVDVPLVDPVDVRGVAT